LKNVFAGEGHTVYQLVNMPSARIAGTFITDFDQSQVTRFQILVDAVEKFFF